MSTATREPRLEERPAVEPTQAPPDETVSPDEAQPGSEPPPGEPEPPQEDFPAEPDEPREVTEPDPEREAVQAREPSRSQLRSLDAELERHRGEVRELMGEFVAGMVECEACNGLGMRPPDPVAQPHPWFKTCSTCAGYGQVLTGSRDEQHLGRDCPRCLGRGYLEGLDAAGTPLSELASSPGGLEVAARAAAGEIEPEQWPADPGEKLEPASHGRPAWMGDPGIGG